MCTICREKKEGRRKGHVINLFAEEIFAKYFYNTNKKKEVDENYDRIFNRYWY